MVLLSASFATTVKTMSWPAVAEPGPVTVKLCNAPGSTVIVPVASVGVVDAAVAVTAPVPVVTAVNVVVLLAAVGETLLDATPEPDHEALIRPFGLPYIS